MMEYLSVVRFWLLLFGIVLLVSPAEAQPTTTAQADSLLRVLQVSTPATNRVEVLLKLSAFYLRKTLNPQQTLDSALVLARQAEVLANRIKFAKGLEEAVFLKGKIYIKQQNAGTVGQALKSVSDINRVRLLLELGKYQLRTTVTHDANPDRARNFFYQAEKLSERIGNQKWKEESQCLIGVSYLVSGDWSQGKAYFTQVIEARQQTGNKSGELKAWLQLATTKFCDDCRQNIEALMQALHLSKQIGDKSQEAFILLELGYKLLNLNNSKQAEHYAFQALKIQKAIGFRTLNLTYHKLTDASVYYKPGDYGYLSNAYYLLSDLSQKKGDLNKKLLYILKAVKSVENSGLLEELDYAYFRLGNAYWELDQFDKSIAYYQQSLAISHQKGELFIQIGLVRRMVIALLKQGKAEAGLRMLQEIANKNMPFSFEDKMFIAQSFGACYNALKQYQLAEKYYLESVAWSKQSALQFHYIAWQRISQFYVATGQYNKADPYLKLLLTASQEQIIPHHLMEIHLMRFKVDSAQANYPAAIRHYQLYKALNDSIFNEKKSKQIAQLSIEYETDKKEQELKIKEKDISLLTEQSKLQETQRNGLIWGTSLLLAMLILSYNRYRLKQRSNHLLETQKIEINQKNGHLSDLLQEKDSLLLQKDSLLGEKDLLLIEKEWLVKEIHHRVKNNLQVVMSLLNSQAAFLEDEAALSAIQESQHRVQAMAFIHQKLYQSESVARIPMADYISEVVAYLRESYDLPQPIRLQLEVESIELDVTQAVPLGLIINEAITNAFKYAFPQGRSGTVRLSLHRLTATTYELTISDDGVGLPVGYQLGRSRSLGMKLLHGFSRQLGGKLIITSPPGLSLSLVFTEEQLRPLLTRVAYV